MIGVGAVSSAWQSRGLLILVSQVRILHGSSIRPDRASALGARVPLTHRPRSAHCASEAAPGSHSNHALHRRPVGLIHADVAERNAPLCIHDEVAAALQQVLRCWPQACWSTRWARSWAHMLPGEARWSSAAVSLVVPLAANLCAHFADEYADRDTGALSQRTWFSGGSGVLPSGLVAPAFALRAAPCALLAGAMATALGWLSPAAFAILLLGLLGGWCYSMPPLALERRGVGELANANAMARRLADRLRDVVEIGLSRAGERGIRHRAQAPTGCPARAQFLLRMGRLG